MYLKIEGSFLHSTAARSLTHSQFRIYVALSLRCLELHTNQLATASLTSLHSSLADDCGGADIDTFRSAIKALEAAGFVRMGNDAGMKILEVCGVVESHPQIKWSGRPTVAGGQSEGRGPDAGRVGVIHELPSCFAQSPITYRLAPKTYRSTESADENPSPKTENPASETANAVFKTEKSVAETENSVSPLDVTADGNRTCDFSAETLSSERTERDESMKAEEAVGRRLEAGRVGVIQELPSSLAPTPVAGPICDAERSTVGSALISPFKTCPEVVQSEPIKEGANLEIGVLPSTRCGLARFGISATAGHRTPDAGPISAGHRTPDASREREAPFSRSLNAALDALLHEDLDHGSICTVLSTLYGRELAPKERLKAMRLADARLFGAMIASGRHRPDKPPIAAFRYYAFGSVMPPDWAMEEVSRLLRSQLMIAD